MSSRALEQTSRIPYFLWSELWANRFALKENDPAISPSKRLSRVCAAFWGRALSEITAVEAAHFLGHLIGVNWEKSPYMKKYQDKPEEKNLRAYLMMEEIFHRAVPAGTGGADP